MKSLSNRSFCDSVPYLSDKREGNQFERAQAGGQQSQSTFASAGGNCEFSIEELGRGQNKL